MARAFYGSKISNNMTKTPEGFLICHNVPIARAGWYEYLEGEVLDSGSMDKIIQVYRSPDEVFSNTAIASFEGKPFVDEHPQEEIITPENSSKYTKGTARNVRRSDSEKDMLIADIVVYDADVIKEIEEGKREISCGYECDYVESDGTYCQTNIRGNHVALVDAGRAGHRVRIKDSDIKKKIKDSKGENKGMSKTLRNLTQKKDRPVNKFLVAVGLKHIAKDAEPEEIADVVDAIAEENSCDEESTSCDEETTPTNDAGEENSSEVMKAIQALTEQMNSISATVQKLVNHENEEHSEGNIIDEIIDELGGEPTADEDIQEEEESVTIPAENVDEEPGSIDEDTTDECSSTSNDTAIAILQAMKPVIAGIKDPKQRKLASDSLKKAYAKTKTKKKNSVDGYSKINNIKKKRQVAQVKDSKNQTVDSGAIGNNLYAKYNANAPK